MQNSSVTKLLLLVVLFHLENVSGIQEKGRENQNHTTLIRDNQLRDFYKRAKPSPGFEENEENSLISLNFNSKIKRDTRGVTNSSMSSRKTELAGHPPPDVISFNKDTLPKCPLRFTYYKDILGNSVCYLITEPAPFPPPCPYPTTLQYFYISWHIKVIDQLHWAFTNRNVSDIGRKNCLLQNGTSGSDFIPTSCTDKYPGVCAYTYDGNYFRKGEVAMPTFKHYCWKRYNDSCISDVFNFVPKCFCKVKARTEKQPRNTFCKKLVEIEGSYLNNELLSLVSGNESCWMGLHKTKLNWGGSDETTTYVWSSTNTTSRYTFWSNNTDFGKTYGALGRDGWSLENDGVLTCAICEMEDEEHAEVHLHINHNKSRQFLEVEIQNAIEVFQNVTCFAQNPDDYETIDLRYNKQQLAIENLRFPFATSGYYWCEALQIANLTLVYSNTIFIPSSYGHEYALLITSPEDADETSYMPESPSTVACNSITKQFRNFLGTSKPIKTIGYNKQERTVEVLCHIHTNLDQLSITDEFKIMEDFLKKSSAKITNFTSIDVCLPSVTTSGNRILQWPETLIGVTTIPEQLCLRADGSSVTRTCAGNFYYGSHWLDVEGTCADMAYSKRTELLEDLWKSNTTTPSNLTMSLLNITENTNNFTSFEIHLISKSLEKLTDFDESVNVTDVTMTVNNIMHFGPSQLRDSQETLNSTDMILYSLDEMLAQTEKPDSGYTSEVTEKLVVQINDLKKTNVNGIKLGKTQNGFDTTKVDPLHRGTAKEDLMKENLDLAMLIPQQLHDDIVNCVGSKASSNLITTVFYDDVLFNEQQITNRHPDGRIISVTIPNFDCPFTAPLQIIFNSANDDKTELKCASWDYGFNDFMESTRGQWFIESDPKTFGNSTYQVCEFRHVTHFTLLVLGDFTTVITTREKALLDVTTAIGSGLSILGLTMIFFTAIMFKNFRSADTPIILLNFSIAMTAQIVLLFVADNLTENKVLCIVFGAALHYLVLCQFCWMLTIALFQYNIHVKIGNTAPNLVTKACVCGWGIPLIPVIIILLISTDNYRRNAHGLCYAVGNYFIFGVLVPVSIMLFINLIVFILIIRSIRTRSELRTHPRMDETLALQIKLAILLFFLLGLTWGFGLLASIDGGIVYSYLFCLTATLQGFVLFVYFIVLNEKTRTLWKNSKVCCCKCENKKAAEGGRRNPQHADVNTNRIELLRWREGSDEDNSNWIRDSVQ